jgi:phenylalanyl-tRNA synthetase beta chain
MRVPLSWLSEFIELTGSPEEIAEILTLSGHEVEEIYDPFAKLGELITVRIIEVIPLEALREVVLCRVTDGKEELYVFTTAKDQVKPNLIVGLAKSGSLTFTHQKVEPRELKGFTSGGMFLSPFEAGLSGERDKLLTFSEDTPIGVSIYQVLKVSEPVLDVAITPNRGDLLSILGIARELNLICGWTLKPLEFEETLKKGRPFPGKISIQDKEGCFRYAGRYFAGIKVEESPFLIRKRLFLCGLRPINNIVDITNYVLLETGQPLHAFDWKRIAGREIIVRRAIPGERLLMLDGVERALTGEDLVIADAEKALVLAGIMGGEDSGVSVETTEIFLESAWFNPKSIRLSGQRHRLTTDSSYRFERKVDPEGVLTGLLRATDLIFKLLNPSETSEIVDVISFPFTSPLINITTEKIYQVLGFQISPSFIEDTFKKLGEVSSKEGTYQVKPHTYRQDLAIPEDLVEEIARLYGYDRIPTTYPQAELRAKALNPIITLERKLKTLLTGFGLTEVITYSFVNPETIRQLNLSSEDRRTKTLELSNPIASHLSVMRTSLLPGLIEVARFNASREVEDLNLFEIGKVFFPDEELADEKPSLGILLKGERRTEPWEGRKRPVDIFDLKGLLEELFSALRFPVEFRPYSEEPFLKRGDSFDLYLGEKRIGWAGALKKFILEELDLKGPFLVAEIELSEVLKAYSGLRGGLGVRKPPKFPSTFRDLSFLVDKGLPFLEVLNYIKSLDWPYLERIELFDLYEGPNIPEDKKSMTLRFWYRSPERTLQDEEVNALQESLSKKIFEHFKAKPR